MEDKKATALRTTASRTTASRTTTLRTTLMVLIGLALLTAVEFAVASLEASAIALFIIAFFKGGMILYYFMQVADLFSEAEDH